MVRRMATDIVWAVSEGTVVYRGLRVRLERGQVWDKSDPLVKDRPQLFSTEPPLVCRTGVRGVEAKPVEAASAVPGEKRATRRAQAE